VLLILLPLFVGILQLGFTLYVRNTLAACAQVGARYAADENFTVQGRDVVAAQAVDRTTICINQWLSSRYSATVHACLTGDPDCRPLQVQVVEVKVVAPVPVIGLIPLGGAGIAGINVRADALQEMP
jgi:hypothetical protein